MKYTIEEVQTCINAHKKAYEVWPHGAVEKMRINKDGIIKVWYSSGTHYHYKRENGQIVWF